ncbi:Helicase, C-terminal,DEAD/DEAH box helicase domain,P-loop containing nucleoside triphosphate [Cinara cedri]|uniref:Helicase, C-terminal,DEAD/DEAH box helicase domain,P-loop containing nucleoside triphosphate n=1 Tax=Cinara cedri TaxID=506608 RepID=A0A5E4NGF1_9HEMI|nr:Helicase, C-terminal,DEAD/DEAH box helicase domain,P-loop containing nucleoside triphosphate [Cinara cedri]
MDNSKMKYEVPGGITSLMPNISADLLSYINCIESLPIYKGETTLPPRDINLMSLYADSNFNFLPTCFVPERDPKTGEIISYEEVINNPTTQNDDDLIPCLKPINNQNISTQFENNASLFEFDPNDLPIAPGMSNKLKINQNDQNVTLNISTPTTKLEDEWAEDVGGFWDDEIPEIETLPDIIPEPISVDEIKHIKKDENFVLKISGNSERALVKSKWVEELDISKPIHNFDELLPDPAYKWEFELDTFQKQAILKLEEKSSVFVAAHTSAGKTVIAEYAIALAKKHQLRCIYTSPIKALSNQKFRDFKKKFADVGLITGDFQVKPEAQCLIVTTEILCSMLYSDSEKIKETEFVILDEVHYVNDRDRGHIWEQILIMLPKRVKLVMLSATVTNVIEFGNWIGRTRNSKIYVVFTLYRPVPLEHYLYVGSNTSLEMKNNMHLIRKSDSGFLMQGYKKASDQFKANQDGKKYQNIKDQKPKWINFLRFLDKNSLFPVVVFILSRKKCDMMAESLKNSVNFLLNNKESQANEYFFNDAIKKLKPEDRALPQVVLMKELLCQGIAVHHSGILPILKEIVEMQFQKSLVKCLFATETFAIGINMPARTVVFDAISKFDGIEKRNLAPAEYTQMAGRAGRRGHDPSGTVIIMATEQLPHDRELTNMMLGKSAKLESQFKVSYSIILNMFKKKNSDTLEDILSNSFIEADRAKKKDEYIEELNSLKEVDANDYWQPTSQQELIVKEFYMAAKEYLDCRNEDWDKMLAASDKSFSENGRFVIIAHQQYIGNLAIILSSNAKKIPKEFRVLLLDNDNMKNELSGKKMDSWSKCIYLSQKRREINKSLDVISNNAHTILTIPSNSIMAITKFSGNFDSDSIIKNWEMRQNERFKHAAISSHCQRAITMLSEKTLLLNRSEVADSIISLFDLQINHFELHRNMLHLHALENQLYNIDLSDVIAFEEVFLKFYEYQTRKERIAELEHQISNKALQLYNEYITKVGVLKELKYINPRNEITTQKGNVAATMGSHELLITELLLCNMFEEMKPEEIAAVLSCLVCESKSDFDLESIKDKNLVKGMNLIKQKHNYIQSVESCYLSNYERVDLNFNLVKVLHLWAQEKPFSEIMEITDIQEGIIVRCIVQLNEILTVIKNAAKTIGTNKISEKMQEVLEKIKRDIVFTPSLYME